MDSLLSKGNTSITETKVVHGEVNYSERSVSQLIKTYPEICPIRIPSQWLISDDGIWYIKQEKNGKEFEENPVQITRIPIVPTKLHIDLDEKSEKLCLKFKNNDKWDELIQPREVFANINKIVSLSNFGLPVTSNNSKMLVQFIFEVISFNKMPVVYTASRCGWKEFNGRTMFILGKNIINGNNGDVKFDSASMGDEQIIKGYRKAGDAESWFFIAERILKEAPVVHTAIYHALTPALMKIVNAPNYCVDLAGDSSLGKTTFLRVGQSVWGAAYVDGELLKSWNSTRVFGERLPALSNDLPVFLDESHLAPEEMRSNYLYMIINGVGRGRGSLKGLQEVKYWNTCLFSTGETPLSQCSQLEGLRARVIPVWGSPFGQQNKILVNDIEKIVSKNHGHAGPMFIKNLIAKQEHWPSLKEQYENKLHELRMRSKSNIESRVCSYLALIFLTGKLYHTMFPDFYPPDFDYDEYINPIIERILGSYSEVNVWKRALEATINWYTANKMSFMGETSGQDFPEPTKGIKEYYGLMREIHGHREICIFPHKLKEFFKREGYFYESIMRSWKQHEVTRTSADAYTLPVKFKGENTRMVVLTLKD